MSIGRVGLWARFHHPVLPCSQGKCSVGLVYRLAGRSGNPGTRSKDGFWAPEIPRAGPAISVLGGCKEFKFMSHYSRVLSSLVIATVPHPVVQLMVEGRERQGGTCPVVPALTAGGGSAATEKVMSPAPSRATSSRTWPQMFLQLHRG